MSKLNLLLETKINDMDANKALSIILEYDTESKLTMEETRVLCWLVQETQKKKLGKLKPSDSPFKMATLFRAKKDIRYYLNKIYSNGTHLIASDGHTVIRINHAVDTGYYYDNGMLDDSIDAKFPDFSRVVETINTSIENQCDPLNPNNERELFGGRKPSPIIHVTSENNEKGSWFNAGYVDRTRRVGATKYYLCDDNLYFVGDNFDGFIMKIRHD